MIIDITGIELIPGNGGKDCPGNGENGNECVHLKCPRNKNYALKIEKLEALQKNLQDYDL